MYSNQVKSETKKGVLVMSLVFVWGLLIFFIISALIYRPWVWYLSVGLIPIIAFLAALTYDIKTESIEDRQPVKKEFWEELDETQITVIRKSMPEFEKKYVGLY